MFWIAILCLFILELWTKLRSASTSFDIFAIFVSISLLLHQPQNLILPVSCALTCKLWNQSCDRIRDPSERTIAKIFLHYWTGKLFYFYQGNSNSLSTIDVNAGFVGQSHVHLPLIFIFTTINTFNGQLIALLHLVYHIIQDRRKLQESNDKTNIKQVLFKWLPLLNLAPASFFLVIISILRHHLFIWSVFSPKLLYDSFVSLLMCFVIILFNFVIKN